MTNFILSVCVFRIAFPLLLTTCIAFRPSLLSGIYLLFLLYSPIVPVPTVKTMAGHTGIYLKLLIAVAVICGLLQVAFQAVLFSLPPYGQFLEDSVYWEKVLRYIGFVRLDAVDALTVTTWLYPEILLVLTSIVIFTFCSKLTSGSPTPTTSEEGEVTVQEDRPKRKYGFWITLGKYLALASLCLGGVLRPSVQGGFYFLIFLSSVTWWACYKELQKVFAIVLRIVALVVFVHIVVLYTYQFQFSQDFLDRNSTYARYFGLTPIMSTNATNPRQFHFNEFEWATYVNPMGLLWLYYVLVIVSKHLLKPKVHINAEQDSLTENTPLIRGVSPSRKYGVNTRKSATILQDSTGSVTVTGENPDDIPMQQLDDDEAKPTCCDNVLYITESILQFVIQTSYIATNIIMMTWSITFHSWLTFVLLLWANILWMVPNQRRAMLKSSPFLVFYAWFLLISAYIYSMDLNEDELPSKIDDVNLAQIGFVKVKVLPCNPLLIKSLYALMFWITLRQYMKERQEAKQNSALADMIAPLQVTVGAAAGVNKEDKKENQSLKKLGEIVKKFLTKFWIWIVAITLFTVAITGDRMTGFRIIYMALFLFFILSFQISFRVWRTVMFGFWLTVIVYSMIILVLVYTYQFDNFPNYWKIYLRVPFEQQLDIGLEKYETTQLFVRLVTPTFFVIIIVIQLHYFHKDFMRLSAPREATTVNPTSEDDSSVQGRVMENDVDSDKTDNLSSLKIDLTDLANVSTADVKQRFMNIMKKAYRIINLIFLFLEIHMQKFVLFAAMLLCVYDKGALHLVIVVFIIIGATTGRKVQMFVIYASSVYVSLLLLARMVYQIQYIQHSIWNVTCETNDTKAQNDAEWLGFNKTVYGRDLPHLVRWNISYILIVTIFSTVLVRQNSYRASRGKPPGRVFFMFPHVQHTDVNKDLKQCLKYLLNYGYYRCGVEISLIATVGLIGFRMDLYAILYGLWLCVLFGMKRSTLASVWYLYLVFIAFFLIVQYVMVIGLPPSLCVDFLWDHPLDPQCKLQDWAFLMSNNCKPSPKKLLCDFLVLLLVSRQAVAFRIERRYKDQDYPGGSNESIIHHAEEKDFIKPVPDFITFTRTYLDIVKRMFMLGFMWVTLAIVFLAGANRVNLFSLGYLVGSFVFLWQGSDFYLRPIPKILKAWNWLLGYNVAVITIKAVLQLVGCIFIKDVRLYCCWLVQLLGIGCVRKFAVVGRTSVMETEECAVPREYIGLAWDGVCFGFLLIQRRIFSSYNFFHVVDETKASAILASRGAELIEQLRQKRMREQDETERKVLEKIKAKMDRIKATQQKIQGPNYVATTNHYVDDIYPKSRPTFRRRQPQSYKEAIRSGDYYMFDELDDDDELDMYDGLECPLENDDDDSENNLLHRSLSRKRTVGEAEEEEGRRRERVVIVDTSEPKPGTSKEDQEFSELSEPKESKCQTVMNIVLFVWAFIESVMISCIIFLNKYSRDYRYVVRVLKKEKRLLKETTNYTAGLRLGRHQMWQPAGSYHSLIQKSSANDLEQQLDEYDPGELSSYDQPTIFRLVLALWYIVLSHSDILCYFVIFLNEIKSATFLSLPLVLFVFLWGTLTIPRPTKTFWVTIIAYTQIIVVLKCLFQFEIFMWNKYDTAVSPFYPPRIIGIERNKNYAVWDLLLLLIVFFHRYILKSLGLWKTTIVPAVVFQDGDYRVSKDDTSEPKRVEGLSTSLKAEGQLKSSKSSPNSRKSSDLQRLVEESEDTVDEEKVESEKHDGDGKVVTLKGTETEVFEYFPDTLQMATSKYTESIKDFFYQLLDPTSRVAADVYSYMFMCDFFNFFVLLIGYSSFGPQQGDDGVSSYLEDNRVPTLFLLMLISQFLLIIMDRAIFLRKNILAKIIFQFIQVLILHVWFFILFPVLTEKQFNSVLPPQIYYMVKCFYLLLSAYQIRCGYPSRILGNFLCKGYNYVNMFLFKAFMLIPFLFELRTVMDWMWTDTSMTVFDWIKMEDIFAHIFQLKCTRHVENEYPQPRGERKSPTVKYLMGGGLLFVIFTIIWFPLVFFSLGNAVGQQNIPSDVTLDMRIGPYESVYQLSAQANSIFAFDSQEFKTLLKVYNKNKVATAFISNYEDIDVAAVQLSRDSASIWSISPPDRERMIHEVNSSKPLSIRLMYSVTHLSNNKEDSGVLREVISITLDAEEDGKVNEARQNLLQMLVGNLTVPPVNLGYILPKFLKVTNRGTAKPITQLMDEVPDKEASSLRTLDLKLSSTSNGTAPEWWEIQENCADHNYNNSLKNIPHANCSSIILYTFNDRIFPATLSIITAGGIIGLYTTLVFVASRLLRGFFAEICFKIMFDDMPNVDRVLQLCLDIYLVREAREFSLEEDLFAKLVFLFRSPETLIKWTRPKEELGDDEDPEGDPE